MSKEWKYFGSINTLIPSDETREEKYKRLKKFQDKICSMKTESIEEIHNRQEKQAAAALTRRNDLLANEAKIKSPALKKEISKIKKQVEKKTSAKNND